MTGTRRRGVALLSAVLLVTALVAGVRDASGAPVAAVMSKPAVPATGAYIGGLINPGRSPSTYEAQTEAFESEIGSNLAIHDTFVGWDKFHSAFLPGGAADADAQAGRIPMISWTCNNLDGGGDAAIINGSMDQTIVSAAKDVANYQHPVFIRWFWEPNLPLPGDNVRPDKCLAGLGAVGYVLAWRHIYQLFQQNGATNAAFVWSVAGGDVGGFADEFYPGDAYVDWVAQDGYARSGQSFSDLFTPFYNEWATHKDGQMPIMVSETGINADGGAVAQATWLDGMFSSLQSSFPDIKAVSYEDAGPSSYDYSLSGAALAAFSAGVHTPYFAVHEAQTAVTLTGPRALVLTNGQYIDVKFIVGGFPAPTLTVTPLPAGLRLVNDGNGTMELKGHVHVSGNAVLTVTASSAAGTLHEPFALTVEGLPTLISSTTLQAAVGVPVSFPVSVSSYTDATTTVTGLPAHFTFTPTTGGGTITGAPDPGEGGSYHLVVHATNPLGSTTLPLELVVSEAPRVASTDAVAAYAGKPLHVIVGVDGYPTPAVSVTGDPAPWLHVDDDGHGHLVLTGTPSTPGVITLVVHAASGVEETDYDLIVTVH